MAYRRAAGPQSLYRRQRPRPCSAQAGIEETTAPQTQQTFRRQSESTFGILFSQVRHSHSPKLHRSSCLRHLMTLRIRDWLMWSQCLFRGSLSSVQSFWIESQTKLQQITSAILLMRCGWTWYSSGYRVNTTEVRSKYGLIWTSFRTAPKFIMERRSWLWRRDHSLISSKRSWNNISVTIRRKNKAERSITP